MSVPDVAELWGLRVELEQVKLAKRADTPTWLQAWRQRERWDARWQRPFAEQLAATETGVNVGNLVRLGRAAWPKPGRLGKATTPPASAAEVNAALQTSISEDSFKQGALAAYLALALDESEDSGQFTLDALGLNETFAWAQAREFAKNTLAVRGSKILSGVYETHLNELAQLVVAKCDPAQPKTIGELTREIRSEWPVLTRKQAARIARTESAFVWETTNWNTMNLNGIETVDWIIATGPAIGKSVGAVCRECLALAAESPYTMHDMSEIPPAHPHCRCTLVPVYSADWLPPAAPWAGAEAPLEVFA